MKTAIVYASYHHHNTEQLAKAMAPVLHGTLYPVLTEKEHPDPADYDLLAIGSGIYKWKFHEKILAYVDAIPEGHKKPVILFSTSAFVNRSFHKEVQQMLEEKGYKVLGHYHTKGSTDFLPDWLTSNRSKGAKEQGRPTREEVLGAVKFAQDVINMLKEV